MNVQELINRLQLLPPSLPVQIKTYGCGFESWTDLREETVQDMTNDQGDRICEIDASWN